MIIVVHQDAWLLWFTWHISTEEMLKYYKKVIRLCGKSQLSSESILVQNLKYSCIQSLHKGSCVSFLCKHTIYMSNDQFRLKYEELFSSCLLSPIGFTLLADVPDSSLKDIWKRVVNIYVSIETHHCIPNTLHGRERCIYSCIWHWLKQCIWWRFSLGVVSNR